MKKNIIRIIIAAVTALATPTAMNAQLSNLLNGVKEAMGNKSTTNTVTDALVNLLGSDKITEKKLAGTWTYLQPCAVLESEKTLDKIGGAAASAKIESTLDKGLTKAGIKSGYMSVTFTQDNKFTFTTNKRQFEGTYTIEGSDVIMTFTRTGKSIKANAKITLGSQLQLAMNADKMLAIVNNIATKASAYASQLKTVSTLLNKYNGLYLGMKFEKKQ